MTLILLKMKCKCILQKIWNEKIRIFLLVVPVIIVSITNYYVDNDNDDDNMVMMLMMGELG